MRLSRGVTVLLAIVLAVAVAIGGFAGMRAFLLQRQNAAVQFRGASLVSVEGGTQLQPPVQVADFELTHAAGGTMRLSDTGGTFRLITFGYTHCPDVCPITLTEFRRVKAELGEAAEDVTFMFVSVDPQRDTPDLLQRYVSRFDPAFVALSGDDTMLAPITQDFGVYYARREVEGTAAGYLVDHTATAFLVDPQGRLVMLFPFNTAPELIAAAIQRLRT